MVSLKLLEKVEAFGGMKDEQLVAIQQYCEEIDFQRNDKLFAEGDKAEHFWSVVEGDVELRFELPGHQDKSRTSVDSVSVAKEGVAKSLGWSCFVPPHKMRLSAYCVSRTCKVVRISRDPLIKLFEEDHCMGYEFMLYLVKVVGYRFQQFQDEFSKLRGEYIMSGW
jgi:CRP-like cAMP-binding protein